MTLSRKNKSIIASLLIIFSIFAILLGVGYYLSTQQDQDEDTETVISDNSDDEVAGEPEENIDELPHAAYEPRTEELTGADPQLFTVYYGVYGYDTGVLLVDQSAQSYAKQLGKPEDELYGWFTVKGEPVYSYNDSEKPKWEDRLIIGFSELNAAGKLFNVTDFLIPNYEKDSLEVFEVVMTEDSKSIYFSAIYLAKIGGVEKYTTIIADFGTVSSTSTTEDETHTFLVQSYLGDNDINGPFYHLELIEDEHLLVSKSACWQCGGGTVGHLLINTETLKTIDLPLIASYSVINNEMFRYEDFVTESVECTQEDIDSPLSTCVEGRMNIEVPSNSFTEIELP